MPGSSHAGHRRMTRSGTARNAPSPRRTGYDRNPPAASALQAEGRKGVSAPGFPLSAKYQMTIMDVKRGAQSRCLPLPNQRLEPFQKNEKPRAAEYRAGSIHHVGDEVGSHGLVHDLVGIELEQFELFHFTLCCRPPVDAGSFRL